MIWTRPKDILVVSTKHIPSVWLTKQWILETPKQFNGYVWNPKSPDPMKRSIIRLTFSAGKHPPWRLRKINESMDWCQGNNPNKPPEKPSFSDHQVCRSHLQRFLPKKTCSVGTDKPWKSLTRKGKSDPAPSIIRHHFLKTRSTCWQVLGHSRWLTWKKWPKDGRNLVGFLKYPEDLWDDPAATPEHINDLPASGRMIPGTLYQNWLAKSQEKPRFEIVPIILFNALCLAIRLCLQIYPSTEIVPKLAHSPDCTLSRSKTR